MSSKLLIVSGPSGTGLGQLVAAVFAHRKDLCAVTPVTARKMKPGETDGTGFYFYDLDGWNALKESGDLLEATEFAGNDYGTSRRLVTEALSGGHSVLLNLEVARAAQVKANMPEAVCVFVEPSPAVLEARIKETSRSAIEAAVRLQTAERERALSAFCDERICSDDPQAALEGLCAILDR